MTCLWVGLDPGLTGALAVIEGEEIEIHDTPVLSVGKRHVIDAARSAALLREIKEYCEIKVEHGQHGDVQYSTLMSQKKRLMVTLEKSQPMPPMGKGGATMGHGSIASFSLGKSAGIWIGILAALEIPYQEVAPQTWKSQMLRDMPKEKDASRIQAQKLWPAQTEEYLSRKKDHNRAEALLLAEWGRRNSGILEE